jgi:hypothetical protein
VTSLEQLKGQLILKGLFEIFNSSINKRAPVGKNSNVQARFSEELKTPNIYI